MSAPMPVVLVTVAGKRFALDAAEVVEVLPAVQYRPAGTGPKWLLGLFNLRGALLPLVDLSVIVDGEPTSIRMGTRIVVLCIEGDLFEGATRSVGLLVPEVAGLAVRDFRAPGAHEGFSFAGAPLQGVAGRFFGTDVNFNVVPALITVSLQDGSSFVGFVTDAAAFTGFYSTGPAITSISFTAQAPPGGSGVVYPTVDDLRFAVIPAPGAVALLGLAGLVGFRRCR
jgi:hypothetical protein